MKENCIRQLKNYPTYFIHNYGYAFKIYDGKEVVIKNYREEKSGTIYTTIAGKKMNILYLLIENFMPNNLMDNQEYKYSIGYHSNGMPCIPLQSIKIKDFTSKVSESEWDLVKEYGCRQRSDNANLRCKKKITPVQVAHVLIKSDFKCTYCNEELDKIAWHLDHYIPLSKNGLNNSNNIVASCRTCNLMKRDLHPKEFYKQIRKISENIKGR